MFQQAHPHVSINLQLNDRKIDVIDEGFDVAIRESLANRRCGQENHNDKATPVRFTSLPGKYGTPQHQLN